MGNRNGRKPNKSNNRSKHNIQKVGKRNFQDRFADEEFMKGEKDKYLQSKTVNIKDKMNDASWYAKNPQMLRDSASFSFNTALGTRMRWDRAFLADQFNANHGSFAAGIDTIPGLMSLTIVPTVGPSVDASSPVNIAAQNVYSYVRYQNSGAANYDAPDLMLYLIAMDSVYSCWNWLKRIYGEISCYSQTNRYRPVAYAAAEHVDISDIQSHLADFRLYLNKAAAQISSFCVPATMSYNIRHSWLYSNIYMDGNTNKAQEYMFVPGVFYKYDETSSPKGGTLVPVNVTLSTTAGPIPNYTFTTLRNLLDSLIYSLSYSEDIGIMSGDILKAYGEGSLFKLSAVEPDYNVQAVFSKEVLSQIENTAICGIAWDDLKSLTIAQDPDTNFIVYNPTISSIDTLARDGYYLNMHMDSPTPEDVMVATRLTCIPQKVASGFSLRCMGSEFVVGCDVFYFSTQNNLALPTVDGPLTLQYFSVDDHADFPMSDDFQSRARRMCSITILSHFDWHPQVCITCTSAGSGGERDTQMLVGTLVDWDKYAFMSLFDLEEMHSVALLSEFNVPTNGSTF